jgi:hypothetical protein
MLGQELSQCAHYCWIVDFAFGQPVEVHNARPMLIDYENIEPNYHIGFITKWKTRAVNDVQKISPCMRDESGGHAG